jgi:cell division septation protein DedD
MIRAALPAAALAAALALAGCSADPGISADTATALQREVRGVAGLAAAHRYPAALSAAATLRRDLGTAVAAGRVTSERAGSIRTALALVETDLRTAQAAASPSPTPTATPTPAPVTPTATPTARSTQATTKPSKKATDAVQKAIDAAKKAAEQRRWKWKGHGKKGWGEDD